MQPSLLFPPFLCSWIRIEGFIFSPTVFVFPPCSSNRREGTSRKHTVRSQNNTLGNKIRLSPFCFCFVPRQSQIVKSQESIFWQIGRCTCLGLLGGRRNVSGQDTKGDKKRQVDVYQLFDTMQVEQMEIVQAGQPVCGANSVRVNILPRKNRQNMLNYMSNGPYNSQIASYSYVLYSVQLNVS